MKILRFVFPFLFLVLSLVGCSQAQEPAQAELHALTKTLPAVELAQEPFFYGVHIHPTWDRTIDHQQLDTAASLGAKVVRLGPSWRLLEPTQGNIDMSWYVPALDDLVQYANSLGLKIILMMGDGPCWGSGDPNKDCSSNEGYNHWYPVGYEQEYANAFAFLASRYGEDVYAFEIWNEPNWGWFWGDKPNAAEYTKLLVASYTAIKAVDPDAIVLGGSLAGTDVEFLQGMYDAGVLGYFDGLALHPYPAATSSPSDCSDLRWSFKCGVPAIHQVMLSNGDESPIYFTELGWSSYDGYQGNTQQAQAEYLAEAFRMLPEWTYVRSAIWYNLMDDSVNNPDSWQGYFGLVTQEFGFKPVARQFFQYATGQVK